MQNVIGGHFDTTTSAARAEVVPGYGLNTADSKQRGASESEEVSEVHGLEVTVGEE